MPSFISRLHVPKSRRKKVLTATNLEVPKRIVHDFDGSLAADSCVPRKLSVKNMPSMPAYNVRTGEILNATSVQSGPDTCCASVPRVRKNVNYTYKHIQREEVPPPVPKKEKRYCFYCSSYLTQSPRKVNTHELSTYQPYQEQGSHFENSVSNEKLLPLRTDMLDTTPSVQSSYNNKVDYASTRSSLKQSSTFERFPLNDSRSTIDSLFYLQQANPSFMNSLLHIYLKEDSESCRSASSSVYENEEPAFEKERAQSEFLNSKNSSSTAKSSFKSLDFCLDTGADYDKSRFLIPDGEKIQSKRYSSSQIPGSSSLKLSKTPSTRSSFEKANKRIEQKITPQLTVLQKTSSKRWSDAAPKSSRKEKKQFSEIRVPPPQRHSADATGYDYREKLTHTLHKPSYQQRASFYVSTGSDTVRSVSDTISQLKQILRKGNDS